MKPETELSLEEMYELAEDDERAEVMGALLPLQLEVLAHWEQEELNDHH